jgi:hypothetical protein
LLGFFAVPNNVTRRYVGVLGAPVTVFGDVWAIARRWVRCPISVEVGGFDAAVKLLRFAYRESDGALSCRVRWVPVEQWGERFFNCKWIRDTACLLSQRYFSVCFLNVWVRFVISVWIAKVRVVFGGFAEEFR